MIFIQFLSIPWKVLASLGIYLAISPPVNTGSKDYHNFYTLNHKSRVELTSEKVLIFPSTSGLKGATCLLALAAAKVI